MPENPPPSVPLDHPFRRKGRSTDGLIKSFFAGNAALTIIILVLIILFLLREGAGFFPRYRAELEVYRKAGLEYVDIARKDLEAHEQMVSLLNRAYFQQLASQTRTEMLRSQEAVALTLFVAEATAKPREALVELTAEPAEGEEAKPVDPLTKARLEQKYQELLENALSGQSTTPLPATPHLSPAERTLLMDQIRARAAASSEDPALITSLQQQLSAKQAEVAKPYAAFKDAIDAFSDTSADLANLVTETGDTVKATKQAAELYVAEIEKRDTLEAAARKNADPAERAKLHEESAAAVTAEKPDFAAIIEGVTAKTPDFSQACANVLTGYRAVLAAIPSSLPDDKANRYLTAFHKAGGEFERELGDTEAKLKAWQWDQPVGLGKTIGGFITGKDWITGGEWQDFYGIVPLFVGSAMISLVALLIAIPFGVGAAIYTNQLAGPRQQKFIKPTIEFIQAIPSVVLGFIGIVVVGTVLQEVSQKDSLSWISGFPIQQRLNMFTAGCLLALMAIPTIFSLAEDAINNVPSAYAEASDALGASKLQTLFRVTVPAATSGILAAVLLGLGRVIGETMVVLLVAGNRIKVPDFTEGLGAFFQPAHTLTGIIAQELGEVPFGSVHYRALFIVGLVLFLIILVINWSAQKLIHRFRTHH